MQDINFSDENLDNRTIDEYYERKNRRHHYGSQSQNIKRFSMLGLRIIFLK